MIVDHRGLNGKESNEKQQACREISALEGDENERDDTIKLHAAVGTKKKEKRKKKREDLLNSTHAHEARSRH